MELTELITAAMKLMRRHREAALALDALERRCGDRNPDARDQMNALRREIMAAEDSMKDLLKTAHRS